MAINRVDYGDTTLIDLTDTTATASDVANGKYFYGVDGVRTLGTGATGLVILSYGNSTWQDFLDAYSTNRIVYCRASSNSNPASGSQTRLAVMAYVNNASTPTNVEFQYYRSVATHSDSQQGDQVFVYKLDKTEGWSVLTRNAFTKIAAGTGLSSSYSNGVLTLANGLSPATATPLVDGTADVGSSAKYARSDHVHPTDTSRASTTDLSTVSGNLSSLQDSFKGFTVTLASDSWFSNEQTVSDVKFIASGYSYIVSPASTSFADYGAAQIYADDVSTDGQMTFHCTSAPSSNLTVNIARVVAS